MTHVTDNEDDDSVPPVMTADQVAGYLHLHINVVRRLAKEGVLPGARLGGQWRFLRTEVDALMRRHADTPLNVEGTED